MLGVVNSYHCDQHCDDCDLCDKCEVWQLLLVYHNYHSQNCDGYDLCDLYDEIRGVDLAIIAITVIIVQTDFHQSIL